MAILLREGAINMELLAVEYSKKLDMVMCLYKKGYKYLITKGTVNDDRWPKDKRELFYKKLEDLLRDEGRLFFNKEKAHKKLLSYGENYENH